MALQTPHKGEPLDGARRQGYPSSSQYDWAQERGRDLVRRLDAAIKNKGYDKDSLSDEQLERIAIVPREDQSHHQVRDGAISHFQKYKHHYFHHNWTAYDDDDAHEDEEWWLPEPPILSENDPDYLCEMCRHIHFEAIFTQRGLPANTVPGPTKIRLRGLDKVIERQNCSFCRMITNRIESDNVIDFSDKRTLELAEFSLNILDEGDEHALRLEIELDPHLQQWPTQRYIIQRLSTDVACPLNGLRVLKGNARPDILRGWLEGCEASHSPIRNREKAISKLRLIDVVDNRIVEAELPCRYLVLSYVWGGIDQVRNVESIRSRIYEPNGLESADLSKTIGDAMEVTKWLNIRYLWVDALCIEQDNPEDMDRIICSMHMIYSEAVLNIVAASNHTPLDGLPGVTSIPRSRSQIAETVQGITMAVAFHDDRLPLAEVDGSKWNSRGWTYQERQLSQRTVFFTESQMVFVCSYTALFEDTVPSTLHKFASTPIDAFKTSDRGDLQMRILSEPTLSKNGNISFQTDDGVVTFSSNANIDFSQGPPVFDNPVYEHKIIPRGDLYGNLALHSQTFWDTYGEAVSAFTERELTDNRDVLPAFQGVSEMIRQTANIQFYYNLPSCNLGQALLWYPKGPMLRRRHEGEDLYPSWSWAGWIGSVSYRGRGWYKALYRGLVTAVKWFTNREPHEWLEEHRDKIIQSGQDIEDVAAKVLGGEWDCLEGVNPYKLYHFDGDETSKWEMSFDEERNQHIYTHKAYGSQTFDYPATLPGEEAPKLLSARGFLSFTAYSAPVRFCDMSHTPAQKQLGAEFHLQIGLGDESRSANYRPPWKRIIYHQGYRAGFLVLNVAFENIDLTDTESYKLVAVSRDEVSRSPPPQPHESWDKYKQIDPVAIQWHIGMSLYADFEAGPQKLSKQISMPDQQVEPNHKAQGEDGHAHWDAGRFKPDAFPLYNVLLVKAHSEKGFSRVGVGKMQWHAFHYARPTYGVVQMR